MKKTIFAVMMLMCIAMPAPAGIQFDLSRLFSAAKKGVTALTLTDAQMAEYVKESVDYMDTQNKVAAANSAYTQRLNRLVKGITQVDGTPLNFKVYETSDVNAFACPDGSVRVFTGLMDIMDDDELLGIIGHEIGHVAMHHSKNAFKQELMNGALADVVASTGSKGAALTESQLGKMGASLATAHFSQKQENEADDCGYNFLVANGRNPWGMVKSFEKLQKMEGDSAANASYFQKMFSSHPDTQARINHMTQRCLKDGYKRP